MAEALTTQRQVKIPIDLLEMLSDLCRFRTGIIKETAIKLTTTSSKAFINEKKLQANRFTDFKNILVSCAPLFNILGTSPRRTDKL